MADITAADLLVGSDEDFVINLYLASLGRWPDPVGFAHMVKKVGGSDAARAQAITDLAVSPEAVSRGRPVLVQDPLLPGEPVEALRRQLALRTDFLLRRPDLPQAAESMPVEAFEPLLAEARADMAALRREMLAEGGRRGEVEAALRDLRAELAALRRELRERAVEAAPLTAPPAGPDVTDYVHDLLVVAEARMELRLRSLEKRLP